MSWRLSQADLGTAPRFNFYADPGLPAGFRPVEPAEYIGSGFDRGHMCPDGDRTINDEASLATFAMTNIIPQAHDVNVNAWEALENYCRVLARNEGKTCYIIAVPSGQGGVGANSVLARTTPDRQGVVPSQNWKVVMVLDQDVASARDLTPDTAIRLIAVIMNNSDGQKSNDWINQMTTVNPVEPLTCYTILSKVESALIDPSKPITTEAVGSQVVRNWVFWSDQLTRSRRGEPANPAQSPRIP